MATLINEINDLDGVDVSAAGLWSADKAPAILAEMRARAPVHYCPASPFGPYWSLTRHADIVRAELRTASFSSSYRFGGITLFGDEASPADEMLPMFIAMDGCPHSEKRRAVAPALGPSELAALGPELRRRTEALVHALPVGEPFDWVDEVAIELTTGMLAMLLDFPWDERRRLTEWSNWAGDIEAARDPVLGPRRMEILRECGKTFLQLKRERRREGRRPDLVSRMIHSAAMGSVPPREYLGHLVLLIIGGNDTTRSTIAAMPMVNRLFPAEWRKLVAQPALIPNAVQELIRWQTPLAHMRRTATQPCEIGGQAIAPGDKVVLWYASANRDEALFPDADSFIADRSNARRHLSFGAGVHRCLGARLAEQQVATLADVLIEAGLVPVQCGPEVRTPSSFTHGFTRMPTVLRRAG